MAVGKNSGPPPTSTSVKPDAEPSTSGKHARRQGSNTFELAFRPRHANQVASTSSATLAGSQAHSSGLSFSLPVRPAQKRRLLQEDSSSQPEKRKKTAESGIKGGVDVDVVTRSKRREGVQADPSMAAGEHGNCCICGKETIGGGARVLCSTCFGNGLRVELLSGLTIPKFPQQKVPGVKASRRVDGGTKKQQDVNLSTSRKVQTAREQWNQTAEKLLPEANARHQEAQAKLNVAMVNLRKAEGSGCSSFIVTELRAKVIGANETVKDEWLKVTEACKKLKEDDLKLQEEYRKQDIRRLLQ